MNKKIIVLMTICVLVLSCSKKAQSVPFYEIEGNEETAQTVTEITIETENKTEPQPVEIVSTPAVIFNAQYLQQYQVYPLQEGDEKKLGENLYYHPLPFVYVLGFSKDGKMLWCENRYIDGRGSYEVTLYVQDLVTDDIVEKLAVNSEDISLENESYENMLNSFLNLKDKEIKAYIQKYSIQLAASQVQGFPGTIGGATYNAKVEVKNNGKLLNDYFTLIDYSCVVEKAGQKSKTVTSKKDCAAENAIAAGYIKSPLEDRIAVIIAEAVFGFEGIDIYYNISGCDLNKNF